MANDNSKLSIYEYASQWARWSVDMLFKLPAVDSHLIFDGPHTLDFSSAFAGLAAERFALELLEKHLNFKVGSCPRFVHCCCFERDTNALQVLLMSSPSSLFGDLLSLLDSETRAWTRARVRSFAEYRTRILTNKVKLNDTLVCSRTGVATEVRLGQLHVAGIPCVDFSPMGLRRGVEGPSGCCLLFGSA